MWGLRGRLRILEVEVLAKIFFTIFSWSVIILIQPIIDLRLLFLILNLYPHVILLLAKVSVRFLSFLRNTNFS
jgi:hypothetical protein